MHIYIYTLISIHASTSLAPLWNVYLYPVTCMRFYSALFAKLNAPNSAPDSAPNSAPNSHFVTFATPGRVTKALSTDLKT